MSEIIRIIQNILRIFRCWIVVSPWEQALRVRLGKRVRLLGPGLHFKMPFIDVIFLQSVRMRMASLDRQTVSTRDGKIVTLAGSIGYAIDDIGKLYMTLHHGEDTIASMAKVAIAEYMATHDLAECRPEAVVEHLNSVLDFGQYGLGKIQTYLTDFSLVRTFRVIGDYMPRIGGILNTVAAHDDGRFSYPEGPS